MCWGKQTRLHSGPDSFSSLVFLSLEMKFSFPGFLFLELATAHVHLGTRGKLKEAVWQHFAVILQVSSQSSGKGKRLNFLQ